MIMVMYKGRMTTDRDMQPPLAPLTDLQQRLVDAILLHGTVGPAARAVGMSEDHARKLNRTHLGVMQAIADGREARASRTEINADWVLQELVAQYAKANVSIENFMVYPEFGPPYIDLSRATPLERSAIESIQVKSSSSQYSNHDVQRIIETKITLPKLSESLNTLRLIGQHVDVQAYREKIDVTMHNVEERLQAGRKRAGLMLVPKE